MNIRLNRVGHRAHLLFHAVANFEVSSSSIAVVQNSLNCVILPMHLSGQPTFCVIFQRAHRVKDICQIDKVGLKFEVLLMVFFWS